MEESEGKSLWRDRRSESSDAASTVKHWNNRWAPTEFYDSSGTTSTSEPSEDYIDDSHQANLDVFNYHNQNHGFYESRGCLCQSCLLGYARVIALQGSLPNICTAAAKVPHMVNSTFHNTACSSCSPEQRTCNCHLPQYPSDPNVKMYGALNSALSGPQANGTMGTASTQSNRCVGSLDRRRKKLKNKIDRDHRAKSQSDLICCEQKINSHYCPPIQQFQCVNNLHANANSNRTEERLRKLENERSTLHMEISILSEQVDVQSSKISELETALQEKKDSIRNMEESLQKEMLSRSALETQKLELLTSISEMKLRQASLEHENLTLRTTNSLTNGERFSRHAGHYSSLPRPPTSAKKGVAFAEEKTLIADTGNYAKATPSKPFVEFSIQEVRKWLTHLGLEYYWSELKRWEATGNKLLSASHAQLEKEIDMKNVLHKKKFLYAIESERNNGAGFQGSDKMDNASVLRWLDDVGLPQHKEAFHKARVDGRVLHRLTIDDLILLNVTAQLHAASLRRGIQVLRELNFEFDNLERRSARHNGHGLADLVDSSRANNERVALWTNHRVMEWLRVVDLAEYAPNMRGSGVHGGLIVYEHRFTSELLATLLSIPPAKTLLRRHLTTHFNEIVGREVVQQKREMESTLRFVPLTLTARIKVPKTAQFTLNRKKNKKEIDFGNLVCPLEESPSGTPSTSSTSSGSPNINSPTP